jgi:hypothetical protein
MSSKQALVSSRNRLNRAQIAMVLGVAAMIGGCQSQYQEGAKLRQAQSPGTRELEVMPQELEAVVKQTVGPEINAIITLGPSGQERTFVTSDRTDENGNVLFEDFPISADQINGVIITDSGVVYLSYEGSPDRQTQCFPSDGCVPVQHSH